MAIRRGEARLREIVAKYGAAARAPQYARHLQDYSERMMRAAIAQAAARRVSL